MSFARIVKRNKQKALKEQNRRDQYSVSGRLVAKQREAAKKAHDIANS